MFLLPIKKANWGIFETRTNELTKDIVTEGKNINNVVKIFNASIVKGANESISRGVRKDYKPRATVVVLSLSLWLLLLLYVQVEC
jgi:hypothetical protein